MRNLFYSQQEKKSSDFWLIYFFVCFCLLVYAIFGFKTLDKICPNTGDGTNAKMRTMDSLKNRPCAPNKIDKSITINSILAPGDDTRRFNPSTYVSITGYVALVKRGGPETCNCHSKDKTQWDTHIEIIADPQHPGTLNAMICEATRYGTIKYEDARKLIGKKVQITGYLFFDAEHWQNARNTNPNGTDLWRATCWEAHPVVSIKGI